MKICEDCRTRNNWVRHGSLEIADCDSCWTRNTQTSEMEYFEKEQANEFYTDTRRELQQQRNKDFEKLPSSVFIYFDYGPRAGTIDHDLSAQLHEIVVKVGNDVDWEATNLRRLRMKDAIRKVVEQQHAVK